MKIKVSLILMLTAALLQMSFAQDVMVTPEPQKGYLVGPGDEITGKVLGEPQFDFVATIDEDGKFQVPFFEQPIEATCRTEKELRREVTKLISKYLRNPQISVRVTDRKSRRPATIFGEVRNAQQVELRREARLLELISFAGGVTDAAGGMIQIFRTQPPMCAEGPEENNWKAESQNALDVPSRMYSLTSLREGKEEANPLIYAGDVIVVQRATPVYITGEVGAPQGIYLKESGTSLIEAIAQVNGVSRQAKTKDIKIYRLKANSKDREIINVNYDRIKKGEQKDIMLQPYDIIEVDKSKKSIAQIILETVSGVGMSAVNTVGTGLPMRVLY
jgi:polysaccharide export outer membrane protein